MKHRTGFGVVARHGRVVAVGALFACLSGTAVRAQDTANSSPAFWVEEYRRNQRQRPATTTNYAPMPDQRVRRLVPHRQFARPTLLQQRPAYADRPVPPDPTVAALPTVPPVTETTLPSTTLPPTTLPATTLPQTTLATPVTPAAPAEPPFVVAVVGDTLASWLAAGLSEAYPAGRGITVLGKGRENSGLVREDVFDWPKAVRDLLVATKVDALVVMIGANDRQPLRGTSGYEEPLSAGWETLYAKRIEALIAAAKDKKIPVLWVGMPTMKNERFALDVGAINEIERTRSEAAGARFIDVFDAFADERGQYSAFGPDVNGTIVKLRANDGIHFTAPGARKLAHFLEGDLRRLREANRPAASPAIAALPPTDLSVPATRTPEPVLLPSKALAVPVPDAVPDRPAIGPILPLTSGPISPGGELLGGGTTRVTDAQRAAVETLFVRPRATAVPATVVRAR